MAKHVILEGYTFNATTGVVNITGKAIRREQLLLITNTTTNTVIYNFSDPSLGTANTAALSYQITVAASQPWTPNAGTGLEQTTIALAYNTSGAGMSNTDKLAILVEETYQEMIPAEVYRDPVEKFRVSTPQALIDTDFEYAIQTTKWESINLLGNRPTAYFNPIFPLANIGNIVVTSTYNGSGAATGYEILLLASSGTTFVNSETNASLAQGTPLFVQGSLDQNNFDGWWIVNVAINTAAISFRTLANVQTIGGTLLDVNKTYIYPGYFYSNATIGTFAVNGSAGNIVANGTPVLQFCTTVPHGLTPGDAIYFNSNNALTYGSGVLTVNCVPSTYTFQSVLAIGGVPVSVATAPVGQIIGAGGATGNVVVGRPTGYVLHRAYDGGVQFTNLQSYHNYQVIRQTRRYFRYQSGKGIQFSTGSMLKPQIFVDNIIPTSSTSITVFTKIPHGFLVGANVAISGAIAFDGNANILVGTYQIQSANTSAFTYNVNQRLDTTTPGAFVGVTLSSLQQTPNVTGFPIIVTPTGWWGSRNRVGMFDAQNGFFFEYDGQNIYAVRRNSVRFAGGLIAATNNSALITGSGTRFTKEFAPGDMVVIRGMSYWINSIQSDSQMYIQPEFRGPTGTNYVMTKTIDTKYVQSSWNIDRCDGTGVSNPSLYNLDLTKMQMFYIDYTWYGAGAVRYGFKNNRGEVFYAHRIVNNNLNTEAYMRSGNLPARYETNTVPPYTFLIANLSASGSSMQVADTSFFPGQGTVFLANTSQNTFGNIEFITYTGKTSTSLTGLTRAVQGTPGAPMNMAGITRGTDPGGGIATAGGILFLSNVGLGAALGPTPVYLYSPMVASTLNHWGSSVIMDGRFDDDKGFVFNVGMNTQTQLFGTGTRYALISLRLAPSVDNGTTGPIGTHEIINRMQLTLRSLDAFTTQTFKMEFILNGVITSNIGIAGAGSTTGNWTNVGGSSLAQYCIHGGNTTIIGGESIYGFFTAQAGATSQDLSLVRDLGHSIIGGGFNNLLTSTYTQLPQGVSVANPHLQMYPDGPDVLTLVCTPVVINSNVQARLSWTESQA